MVTPVPPMDILFEEPRITLGLLLPEISGSNRIARASPTQSSSGLLSLVPRKFPLVGLTPLLPVSDQPPPPPLLAIVSVFPLGVIVTFAPGDNVTASSPPLRLFTTWPLPI